MKKRAVLAALLSALMLCSCAENTSEEKEDTSAVTTASAVETSGTELTEATEDAAEAAVVFGKEYIFDLDEFHGFVTVDADKYSEVTEEDLDGFRILQNNGLRYIDVINSKGHDLSFLADIDGVSDIRFFDMEQTDFEFLRSFDELTSVEFINIGSTGNLLDVLNKTDVESAAVRTNDFSLSEGIRFTRSAGKFHAVYTPSEEYQTTPAPAPTDRPYVIASPSVRSYLADGEPLNEHSADKRFKGNGNTLTAIFCNPTDKEILLDSVSISDAITENRVPMADGSSCINLNKAVAPHEEFCIELTKDMFDYSKTESGIYNVKFCYGEGGNEDVFSPFILKHSEENEGFEKLADAQERRAVFEKGLGYVREYFSNSVCMTEEYASAHTADEFISQFTDVFTYDCAKELASSYIDENGNLKAVQGDRGSDITLIESYFITYEDNQAAEIVCVTAHNNLDISYRSWLECRNIRMIPTADGWRIDKFTIWW